jgi:hypothetical protein
MKSQALQDGELLNNDELVEVLTIHVFPLVAQLLMISEEPVQTEGVKSLGIICSEELMNREDIVFVA